MKTIVLSDEAFVAYDKAMEIIETVRKTDPETADSMAISFLQGWTRLIRLLKNGYSDGASLNLFSDFVPGSFEWSIVDKDKSVFVGGMILHGFQETFSVELVPQNKPHWGIHT